MSQTVVVSCQLARLLKVAGKPTNEFIVSQKMESKLLKQDQKCNYRLRLTIDSGITYFKFCAKRLGDRHVLHERATTRSQIDRIKSVVYCL